RPLHSLPTRRSSDLGKDLTRRMDLVMEGGGVKGIALAGALEVLEERGYSVNRVAGSSAGAIAGTFATAGIPARTIVEILRETDRSEEHTSELQSRFD